LKDRGQTLRQHWERLIAKLDAMGLIRGHEYQPAGHSYFLRGRAGQVQNDLAYLVGDAAGLATLDMGEGIQPAVRSGLLAAEAILKGREYSVASIQRTSWPSLFGLRG
jgi:flavin-dependent dehydrogenase